MSKFCRDCGKRLGFFSKLSGVERCEDCEKKSQMVNNTVKIKSPDYIPPIQQQVKINKIISGSVGGEIEYYKLQEWWLNTLTSDEQNILLSIYRPLGLSPDSLVHGKITSSSQSEVAFLSNLSGWVKQPEYRRIGYKLIEKAESSISNRTPIMDRHFLYQAKKEIYYRNRDMDDFALPTAIEACKQQIALSKKAKQAFLKECGQLPSHAGYKQLCIIMEKQKNYDEAIRLANEAKMQGWTGDWDKRIERCMKKMST
ncbi:hypothetical protein [Methanogenium organophilum]|uniref:Uncharacterized protein n=1 Tax=Methanogenium organophilum TaxID=2199 RepID=A0A9X9T7S3_METOG|nr:hypothetical protein [Methanogenium organophilum]WAI00402.1 hypothetical protein OU421_08155 [Methanogenium organophilum]